MRVLRTFSRFIRITVLSLAMVNLHGFAAAAHVDTGNQCQSLVQPEYGSPKLFHAAHPGPCCAKVHCCAIPELPPFENAHAPSPARPSLLAGAEPFLLVRALDPPPKARHF